jgi:predicted O-methyltransferase YrrM
MKLLNDYSKSLSQLGGRNIDLEKFSDTIATIDVDNLHNIFDIQEKLQYPDEFRQIHLTQWRMEIHDSPIFRWLYRNFQPRRHLEFGTWQGAGTVYCLEECDAAVWTINLPFGEVDRRNANGVVYASDESYDLNLSSSAEWSMRVGLRVGRCTDSFGFIGRFYLEKGLGHRVCQIYTDSAKWDTSAYPDGFFDSVLIDGGHNAKTVCNDTIKAMRLIRSGGLLLWHDCCPPIYKEFEYTKGVLTALQIMSPFLQRQLSTLFWVQPSWICIGIKR